MSNLPLDDQNYSTTGPSHWKFINLILTLLIILYTLLLIIKIWYDARIALAPFPGKMTAIYTNGAFINFACFALGGLIPGIFLRWRKKYLLSFLFIVFFLIPGYYFAESIHIYEHFYDLIS